MTVPAEPAGPVSPPGPLRLLLLAPATTTPGGVAEYAAQILNRLPPSWISDHLAIGRRPGEAASGLPLRMACDYLRFLRCLRGASRPTVLHLNPSFTEAALLRDGLFLLLARLVGQRGIVVTFHGWRPRTERRIRAWPVARRLLAWTLGRADRILVLAEPFRTALIDIGVDAGSIETGTTMFDGALFGGTPPDLSAPRKRILFLSRFAAGKGGAALIAAFAALHEKHPDLQLTMAGAGTEEAAWRSLAAASRAAAAIDFPGYVSGAEKARLLRETLVFVLASETEGMPVALLEAMAAGAAVLASRVGGVPLAVQSGVTGLLLDENDAHAVEGGLRKLLADRGRAAAMGRAGALLAWRSFEAARVVADLERIYREAAACRPTR